MLRILALTLLAVTVWSQTSEVPPENTPDVTPMEPNELQRGGGDDNNGERGGGRGGNDNNGERGGGGGGGRSRCGFTFCPSRYQCVFTQGSCYWYWIGYWYWYCPGFQWQCVPWFVGK